MPELPLTKISLCQASNESAQADEPVMDGLEVPLPVRVTRAISPLMARENLGAMLRRAYLKHFGKRPMEDPLMDAIFLGSMDDSLPFTSEEIEAAFYE